MATNQPQQRGSQHQFFYLAPKQDDEATAREGRPIFVDVPWVKIFTPGDPTTVIDQPAVIDPVNQAAHNNRYPEAWARFKAGAGADEQMGGTPLSQMPGISASQVREMEHFHIRTVEQLATMADGNALRFPGVVKLKAEAALYLERAAGAAADKRLLAELSTRDAEIDALKKQVAELAKLAEKQNEKRKVA